MNTTIGEITQPFIKATLSNCYETRAENPKIAYGVLRCVIYTIIKNYVCIEYIDCQANKLSKVPVGYRGVYKHRYKSFDRTTGIGISYLLMNLISCHGFLMKVNYVVIIKFPKRMLE